MVADTIPPAFFPFPLAPGVALPSMPRLPRREILPTYRSGTAADCERRHAYSPPITHWTPRRCQLWPGPDAYGAGPRPCSRPDKNSPARWRRLSWPWGVLVNPRTRTIPGAALLPSPGTHFWAPSSIPSGRVPAPQCPCTAAAASARRRNGPGPKHRASKPRPAGGSKGLPILKTAMNALLNHRLRLPHVKPY